MNVVLYTATGCHLCEAVEAVIAHAQKHQKFHFFRRDISEDAADFELYKHDIPVVLVDGVEVARHRLSARQLKRALAGE